MSQTTFRLSKGSGPRRFVALCVGVLVPLLAALMLSQGLTLKDIDLTNIPMLVEPAPPPTKKVEPTPPIPQPDVDASFEPEVDAPEINYPPGDAITVSTRLDAPAAFVSTNRLPLYPATARANCEQGEVVLTLRIGSDGRVGEASLATSSGYADLDAAAVAAAKSWRYRPAKRAGSVVETVIEQTVSFDLKNEVGLSMTERELRACQARQ